MKMSRLETIEKIKELEERKEIIKDTLNDLKIWFGNSKPIINVNFRRAKEINTKKFEVNRVRLEKFLETELYHLEEKIAVLIGEL